MDLSLRPDHETYKDRDNETVRILSRIEDDTSNSLGISGVRGSGKSSLLRKVINELDDKGYFVSLLSAPTHFEQMGFFITMYQKVCTDVEEKIERRLGINKGLEERHRNDLKRSVVYFRILFVLAYVVSSVPIALMIDYDIISSQRQQIDQKLDSIDSKINLLSLRANIIIRELAPTGRENLNPDSLTIPKTISILNGWVDSLKRIPRDTMIENSFTILKNNYFIGQFSTAGMLLSRVIEKKEEKQSLEEIKKQAIPIVIKIISTRYLYFLVFLLPLSFLVYKIFLERRKYKLLKAHSINHQLSQIAKQKIEYLQFQSKQSNKTEISAKIWKLSSKLAKDKTLENRPISLPGITADFIDFMNLVSEMFSNKAIICFDELDKISDSDQLNEMLKAIKGIIGSKNLHCILTVSEDALAQFSTRFRNERNLIESSFEEIIHLGRIEYNLGLQIIEGTMNPDELKPEDKERYKKNTLLAWGFSSGIPRELKRNLLKLRDNNLEIHTAENFILWKLYFIEVVNSLYNWAKLTDYPDPIKSKYLLFLDDVKDKTPPATYHDKSIFYVWLLKQMNTLHKYKSSFLDDNMFDDDKLEQGLLELLISAFYLKICFGSYEEAERHAVRLQALSHEIPHSVLYTKRKLKELMELENIEQEK